MARAAVVGAGWAAVAGPGGQPLVVDPVMVVVTDGATVVVVAGGAGEGLVVVPATTDW